MDDPGSPADVFQRMSKIAPLNESDAGQLHQLLTGVRAAAERMSALAPVFPAEINPDRLSMNVDGDES